MKEEWRDIKGYEGEYQVSSFGRVKSLNYNRTKKEKILKPGNNRRYLYVILCKNGKSKMFLVHRLVADTFISNPNNYFQVNHKDENKQNNRVDNLEWCTQSYNINYGTRTERVSNTQKGKNKGKYKGSKNPRARKVQCITTGKKFNCITEAVEYYYLNYGTKNSITNCCQGKLKSAGKHPVTEEKLIWRYLD